MTDNDQPIISPEEEASDEEFKAAIEAALEASSVVDDTPVVAGDNVSALDSLQGNEFAVEIEGEAVTGIFRVTGLTTFQRNQEDRDVSRIVIAKMVQRDASLPFNQWIQETVATGIGDAPTRTLTILAIDDGDETRRWTLKGAYILSVRYSDFDTSSSEFVEEIVSIAYDSLVETWTWSDQQ